MKFICFVILEDEIGFAFAVARHSLRSHHRRSKQAMPLLAPVVAVAKREGYQLDRYSIMAINVFKFIEFSMSKELAFSFNIRNT